METNLLIKSVRMLESTTGVLDGNTASSALPVSSRLDDIKSDDIFSGESDSFSFVLLAGRGGLTSFS